MKNINVKDGIAYPLTNWPEETPTYIEAMTHELSKGWEQPDRTQVLIYSDRAEMTKENFDKLLDYTKSQPSAVSEGKMYRKENYLHWWTTSKTVVNHCQDNVRLIKVVEKLQPYSKLCAAAIERSLETPFGDEEQIEVRDLLYQLICDHPNNCTDRMCNCKLKDGQYFIPDLPAWEIQYQRKAPLHKDWEKCSKTVFGLNTDIKYRTTVIFKELVGDESTSEEEFFHCERAEENEICDHQCPKCREVETDKSEEPVKEQNPLNTFTSVAQMIGKPERSDNELIESQDELWNEVITDFGNFVGVEGLSSKFKLIRR